MSDKNSGGKVDNELANRLDTLFEDDAVAPTSNGGDTDDPLDDLQTLVMSIEWEITDELMGRFVSQVEVLKKRYKDDRILVMFLQLLGSLGLYVKLNKGNAHPTAFSLLNSVHASFANAAIPGKISSSEKKKLLYIELNKYKELKEKIGLSRETTNELPVEKESPRKAADQEEIEKPGQQEEDEVLFKQNPTPQPETVTPQQLEEAIQGIKQLIRDEFKILRNALVQKRKS